MESDRSICFDLHLIPRERAPMCTKKVVITNPTGINLLRILKNKKLYGPEGLDGVD